MNSRRHYDLVVIGSGAAGRDGAIRGAKLGKTVAVIERGPWLGGVSFNNGIPSRTLREAVIGATSHGDNLADRIEQVASNESTVYANRFRRNGVDVFTGDASFLSPNLIQVTNADESLVIEADRFLIATGTRPAHNPDIPFDDVLILDTVASRRLPRRKRVITIVGGGVIGVEYACIAAELEASVTLIERQAQILDFIDSDLVEALSNHMRRKGVTFRLGEEVESVGKNHPDGKVCATLKSGNQVWSDDLLYAVGRQGNTESLNLSAARLEADSRGRIQVNDRFQTGQPNIYAAGDVIGFSSLASLSMEQGRVAVCHAFGEPVHSVPDLFPYGIYTIPEIAFVGKTEEQLTREATPYEVGIAHYQEIARGQIIGDTTGLLKLLFHRKTLRLLGVHILGERATKLIRIGETVLALEGSINCLLTTVFHYPTLVDWYKVAALNGMNRLHYSSQPANGVEYATG